LCFYCLCCARSPEFELVNKIIFFTLAPKPGDFGERRSGDDEEYSILVIQILIRVDYFCSDF
jgi:hypothetical protein